MLKTIFHAIITPMITLTATKRSKTDQLKTVRSNGMVPAVVYGARMENTSISVPSIEFTKVFKQAGESTAIVLDIEGTKVDVLIHDVQFDPMRGFVVHVDFLSIDMNKPVEVTIPLEFEGVSPAEKGNLGTLVKVLHEVDIKALPKDIPHNLVVDISSLDAVDTQIHVSDIKLPKGITMETDGEEVVALIAAQHEIVEEVAPAADLSSIEVEKKGKKDEEEAPTEEK